MDPIMDPKIVILVPMDPNGPTELTMESSYSASNLSCDFKQWNTFSFHLVTLTPRWFID